MWRNVAKAPGPLLQSAFRDDPQAPHLTSPRQRGEGAAGRAGRDEPERMIANFFWWTLFALPS